jgi:hypothetical protein
VPARQQVRAPLGTATQSFSSEALLISLNGATERDKEEGGKGQHTSRIDSARLGGFANDYSAGENQSGSQFVSRSADIYFFSGCPY